MCANIWKLDRYRKLLNADMTSAYPVRLKSVEPIQKHVNKCGQRIIPELNGIVLLKLCHEWKIQNGSEIKLKRNYNPCQSRKCGCDVGTFHFFPSQLRIWLPVQP